MAQDIGDSSSLATGFGAWIEKRRFTAMALAFGSNSELDDLMKDVTSLSEHVAENMVAGLESITNSLKNTIIMLGSEAFMFQGL